MAVPLKALRPVTDEALLDLAERNPGYQFERMADGELVVTPTGGASGRRENALNAQLYAWAERNGQGVTFSPSTMFILPDGSRLMPDGSWIRRDRYARLTNEAREGWLPLCPDAVFEIRSASQPLPVLREKMRAYLANGAQIGALIDPYGGIIEIYRPGREPEIHTGAAAIAMDPELPGLMLDATPLFAE